MAGIKNLSKFTDKLSRYNQRLQQTFNETGRDINRELEEGMKRMQYRAQDYVPVDEEDMTDAIKTDIDRQAFRRNIYSIYVDEAHPTQDGKSVVGDYLRFLHENREYKLGEKSIEKARALGVEVGPKFMTRAYQDERDQIVKRVRQHLRGNNALKRN